jgi:hypothetical protein
MKKQIILVTLLTTFGTLFSAPKSLLEYEEPMAPFIGDIVFPTNVDPDLCLYYKGNKIQLDINHDKKSKRLGQLLTKKELVKIVPYALNEAKATQKIHLLICQQPEFSSLDNTINYLYVPENMSYKFYTLTATRTYDSEKVAQACCWDVVEEVLAEDQIIPDNTVIFLFNANFIAGLEVKNWPLNSNIRVLPTIIMHKNIDPEDIVRAIVQARMIAIDFDTIHNHHVHNASKIEHKTVVVIKP